MPDRFKEEADVEEDAPQILEVRPLRLDRVDMEGLQQTHKTINRAPRSNDTRNDERHGQCSMSERDA